MLSQTAAYALRAVIAIAEQGPEPVGAASLAERLEIPRNYLSKTLHHLARAGVLQSSRGKRGGFTLSRPAGRIRLLDVVGTIDAITGNRACLLGRPVCSDHHACSAHQRWKGVAEKTVAFFRETTVADLLGAKPV